MTPAAQAQCEGRTCAAPNHRSAQSLRPRRRRRGHTESAAPRFPAHASTRAALDASGAHASPQVSLQPRLWCAAGGGRRSVRLQHGSLPGARAKRLQHRQQLAKLCLVPSKLARAAGVCSAAHRLAVVPAVTSEAQGEGRTGAGTAVEARVPRLQHAGKPSAPVRPVKRGISDYLQGAALCSREGGDRAAPRGGGGYKRGPARLQRPIALGLRAVHS